MSSIRKVEILFIKYEKLIEIGYIIFCGCIFFLWSISAEYDTAPDELMRYQIPQYIYQYGALPNGDLEILRNDMWGFSYAYYPNMLGPILSAIFMKFASIFSDGDFTLLVAARFTSVLFGAISVLFFLKCCKRIFSSKTTWVITIFISMIPQFVYLSSYVNNDIICIGGSAIICYSCICGLQDGWCYKNSFTLSIGIIICALSYYNSYGWILCSIILFVFSYILRTDDSKDYDMMLKYGLFISVITLIAISGFFIRNAILYDGDFLGMASLTESSEKYALDWLKPSKRNIAANTGMSVGEMLRSKQWTAYTWSELTYKSFIGAFGYMRIFLSERIYNIYKIVLSVLVIGLCGQVYRWIRRKDKTVFKSYKYLLLFYLSLGIAFCIPICLSIYYSYAVDYEPQGRYCYPMIVALGILLGSGYEWYIKKFNNLYAIVISGFMIISEIGMLMYVYSFCFIPAINGG